MGIIDIFNIFAQNIDCGYMLEPSQGGSKEYPQSMVWIKKGKYIYHCLPQFDYITETAPWLLGNFF